MQMMEMANCNLRTYRTVHENLATIRRIKMSSKSSEGLLKLFVGCTSTCRSAEN